MLKQAECDGKGCEWCIFLNGNSIVWHYRSAFTPFNSETYWKCFPKEFPSFFNLAFERIFLWNFLSQILKSILMFSRLAVFKATIKIRFLCSEPLTSLVEWQKWSKTMRFELTLRIHMFKLCFWRDNLNRKENHNRHPI